MQAFFMLLNLFWIKMYFKTGIFSGLQCVWFWLCTQLLNLDRFKEWRRSWTKVWSGRKVKLVVSTVFVSFFCISIIIRHCKRASLAVSAEILSIYISISTGVLYDRRVTLAVSREWPALPDQLILHKGRSRLCSCFCVSEPLSHVMLSVYDTYLLFHRKEINSNRNVHTVCVWLTDTSHTDKNTIFSINWATGQGQGQQCQPIWRWHNVDPSIWRSNCFCHHCSHLLGLATRKNITSGDTGIVLVGILF